MKLKPFILAATAGLTLTAFNSSSFAQEEVEEAAPFERAKEFRKKRFEKRQEKKMREVDTNEDGQIDLNEYLTHAEQRFNLLDANSDGFVTTEEQQEAHQKMREEFKQRRQARREQREQESE